MEASTSNCTDDNLQYNEFSLLVFYFWTITKNSINLYEQEAHTHNKVLPKAGLNGFDWTFVHSSTFVLRLNFCVKNPRLWQYPNRYAICQNDSMLKKIESTI